MSVGWWCSCIKSSVYNCRLLASGNESISFHSLQAAGQKHMVDEPRNIHREVLRNGITVLTETMPHIRSVSTGIWLRTGSRDEEAAANGISHFLEHMVFKGTKTR